MFLNQFLLCVSVLNSTVFLITFPLLFFHFTLYCVYFYVQVTVHRVNSYNKTNYIHQFLKFIFGIKLYMFRTVPLSITSSFSLYTQQRYMSYRFADSLRAGSGRNQFCQQTCMTFTTAVYSEKLLMMDRGTVRNM